MGYLDNDGKYAFEGQALIDVEACAFDRLGFDAFAAKHPDLGAAVAEALSAALDRQVSTCWCWANEIYRVGGSSLG